MDLRKISLRLEKAKSGLRMKYKKQGLSKSEIEIKMNALDSEFLIHAFVNGKFLKKSTSESRLDFYVRFLERELKDWK